MAEESTTLTKNEIARLIYGRIASKNRTFTVSQASECVSTVCDAIAHALAADRRVVLSGLGIFRTIEQAERSCRNPHTGELMTIPARRTARWSPAKELLTSLRK